MATELLSVASVPVKLEEGAHAAPIAPPKKQYKSKKSANRFLAMTSLYSFGRHCSLLWSPDIIKLYHATIPGAKAAKSHNMVLPVLKSHFSASVIQREMTAQDAIAMERAAITSSGLPQFDIERKLGALQSQERDMNSFMVAIDDPAIFIDLKVIDPKELKRKLKEKDCTEVAFPFAFAFVQFIELFQAGNTTRCFHSPQKKRTHPLVKSAKVNKLISEKGHQFFAATSARKERTKRGAKRKTPEPSEVGEAAKESPPPSSRSKKTRLNNGNPTTPTQISGAMTMEMVECSVIALSLSLSLCVCPVTRQPRINFYMDVFPSASLFCFLFCSVPFVFFD